MNEQLDLSIVVPTYNEEENVSRLHKQVTEVLSLMKKSYEIIFIDDGSSDNTYKNLELISKKDSHVRIIKFRSNFGQTAGLDAGFKNSRGKIIIAMDADLQNDPRDIPRLLKKIDEGYDVVSGWRKNRKDTFFKRFSSRGANILRKMMFNDKIHDSGCTLKAYRKECFDDVSLYGEMHRFIPAILQWKGFKVTEIVVRHHNRRYGQTKYGMKRTIKGFLDMIVVKFWMQYSARPMHIFGGIGLFMGLLGFFVGLYLFVIKIFFHTGISDRPLLILTAILLILGTQFILFGILADIMIKLYYHETNSYSIDKIISLKKANKLIVKNPNILK